MLVGKSILKKNKEKLTLITYNQIINNKKKPISIFSKNHLTKKFF